MAVISVENLCKRYLVRLRRPGLWGSIRDLLGSGHTIKQAVDDISFEIEPGETVGYVGPNGAGKSTTIKVLTGILVPSSGKVRVNGLEPWRHRKLNGSKIGVVFGQRTQLWWDLPVTESFEILRYIYRVPYETYRRNLDMFMELLGIDQFKSTPVRLLSLGQRMRAEVASAFLHDPSIVYLDEPTIGLDVVAKERIREFLEVMNRERNMTIMLTTHDLPDIERVCKRLILIDQGKLAYDGGVEAFKRRYGRYRTLVLEMDAELPVGMEFEHGEIVRREGNKLWLRFDRDQMSASDLLLMVAQRYPIIDCSIEEPTIESILRMLYERKAVDA